MFVFLKIELSGKIDVFRPKINLMGKDIYFISIKDIFYLYSDLDENELKLSWMNMNLKIINY